MDPQLLRNSLRLAVSVFVTAALAMGTERIAYVWYPILAVVMVVDDNDERTISAASARILGTLMGGLVTFLVHTVLSGWPGVLVSLVLMIPVLRLLGWQAGLNTAGLVSVMFLMVPSHVTLDWSYAFNRALDTAVGCLVALGAGLLFWPRHAEQELLQIDGQLRQSLAGQLRGYGRWLRDGAPRPAALSPAPLTAGLLRLEDLVNLQRQGTRRQQRRLRPWERRLEAWRQVLAHWVAWERLLEALPPQPPPAGSVLLQAIDTLAAQLAGERRRLLRRDPDAWQALAAGSRWPLLPLLAVAEELRPLQAHLAAIARPLPQPIR